jgi:long-subunit fatty acid transport protein
MAEVVALQVIKGLEPSAKAPFLLVAILLSVFVTFPSYVFASNGVNLPAYSAGALGQGGADLVSINDTTSLNNNPAAMSLIGGGRVDLTLMYIHPFYHYSDASNNLGAQNDGYLPGNLAYVGRLGTDNQFFRRLTIGAGIFSQGGFGSNYQRVNTIFGTTDSASSYLRYVKFAFGVSYDVIADPKHNVSVGIAPHLGYSDLALSFFPGTSVAPTPGLSTGFGGVTIKDSCARNLGLGSALGSCPHDWVAGVKVGLMYSFRGDSTNWTRPRFAIGASYTSPVNFTYNGSHMDVNLSNIGLGTVSYDLKVEGFKWAEQVDVGFAYRPVNSILLALDVSWIHWSTINTVTLRGSNPHNPIAAATPALSSVTVPLIQNWKDQAVIALGIAIDCWDELVGKRSCDARSDSWFDLNELTVRAGYNYSNNPVPSQNLTPIAAIIIEHHVTGGLGYRFSEKWSADVAGLYGFKNTQNTSGFLTNGAQSTSGFFLYGTISRFF